jgi:hypothetical protein
MYSTANQAPVGYPAPPAPPQKNGFAVTALIFGIIGGIPLAIGFGIAGLVRAGKVGKGKAMSWIGIVLAILWLAPSIYVVSHLSKALDPGCISAESLGNSINSKLDADTSNPGAMKTDLSTIASQLDDAAAKSNNATARDAIKKFSADIKELLADLNNGTAPAGDLVSRIEADGQAVDTACGR